MSDSELTRPERAALAALGWRDRYIEENDAGRTSAGDLLFEQLNEIYGPAPRPAEAYEEVMTWTPRTMTDARVGDVVRPGHCTEGPGVEVTARYLPPRQDGGNAGTWHVISGGANHWDDRVVRPGELWLQLGGMPPRNFKPDFPIDILLTINEMQAIEALGGWANRMDAS